jgi:hypothetical protein
MARLARDGLAGSVPDARLLAGDKSFELSTVILLVITLAGLIIGRKMSGSSILTPRASH